MWWWRIGLCGAFGGMAPSLLELAALARGESLPGSGFYVSVGIFALIGAGMALVHKEELFHKAFFLGVAAPALIVAAGSAADVTTVNRQEVEEVRESQASILETLGISTVAYAQEPTDVTQPFAQYAGTSLGKSGERHLMVNVTKPSKVGSLAIRFTANGSEIPAPREIWKDSDAESLYLEIPPDADGVSVRGEGFATDPIVLPSGPASITLSVDREENFLSGLFTGLGMKNRANAAKTTRLKLDPGGEAGELKSTHRSDAKQQ